VFTNTKTDYGKPPHVCEVNTNYPVSRIFTKGSAAETLDGVAGFASGRGLSDELAAAVDEAVDLLFDHEQTVESEPHIKTDKAVYDERNKASNPGEPLRSAFAKVSDLHDSWGQDKVLAALAELEAKIEQGEPVEELFLVFSKKDKYNLRKLFGRRFRTIQGSSYTLYHFMTKHLSWAQKRVEESPYAMTSFTLDAFVNKLVRAVGTELYVATDFSDFDRLQPGDVVEYIMRKVCRKGGLMSKEMEDYICESVAYGNLAMSDATLVERNGGNPSGHALTTVLNTIFHMAMVCLHARRNKFAIPGDVKPSLCGDDSIYGSHSKRVMESFANDFATTVMEAVGMKVKFEVSLAGDRIFQFPEIPTFLGRKLIKMRDGNVIPVLVDVPRVLATVYNHQKDTEHRKARMNGIMVSLAGWVMQIKAPLDHVRVPDCIRLFVADYTKEVGPVPSYADLKKYAFGRSCDDSLVPCPNSWSGPTEPLLSSWGWATVTL